VVAPSAGEVVLVPFPFSDLSQSKLRPAVCLADAGHGDWVLCQFTSNPYGDHSSVTLGVADFASGGLSIASFARPGELFTASTGLMVRSVAPFSAIPPFSNADRRERPPRTALHERNMRRIFD
jgi:mRNA interferase MazF